MVCSTRGPVGVAGFFVEASILSVDLHGVIVFVGFVVWPLEGPLVVLLPGIDTMVANRRSVWHATAQLARESVTFVGGQHAHDRNTANNLAPWAARLSVLCHTDALFLNPTTIASTVSLP